MPLAVWAYIAHPQCPQNTRPRSGSTLPSVRDGVPARWSRAARNACRDLHRRPQDRVHPRRRRSTPGAENMAAAWSDEAAEDALLGAAERNGYVADHSAAAARSAIRSGLRNGLRSPRPLPDFGSGPVRAARDRQRPRARPQPSSQPQAEARQSPQVAAAGLDPSPAPKARSAQASSRDGPAADHIAASLRAAGFKPSRPGQGPPGGGEGYLVQSSADRGTEVRHAAVAESVNGIPPWDRTDQMIDRYAGALGHAGFEVARTGLGSLA